MAIEVSSEIVFMPDINKRIYQLEMQSQYKWKIVNTDKNTVVKKGNYQYMEFRCYYLNKAYYKQTPIT